MIIQVYSASIINRMADVLVDGCLQDQLLILPRIKTSPIANNKPYKLSELQIVLWIASYISIASMLKLLFSYVKNNLLSHTWEKG